MTRMGYYEYLKDLMAPMGYYELQSGPGAMELFAEGDALDGLFEELLLLEAEAFAVTASSFGLERYEDIVPTRPMSETIEDRRAALMALMRIDGCGFTAEALRNTLRGCGINVTVEEDVVPMTLKVAFPGVRGMPVGFDGLRKRIEQILPCHLEINYVFTYIRWLELEAVGTWAELESRLASWFDLEAYL